MAAATWVLIAACTATYGVLFVAALVRRWTRGPAECDVCDRYGASTKDGGN